MEAYTDFAAVYDIFMDETPYEEWADYIASLLLSYGCPGKEALPFDSSKEEKERFDQLETERNTVVDLGCGTGTLTQLLATRGFDMIGIDSSREMLSAAIAKKERSGLDILYLNQDMREFELYGTVGAVVSVCDSLNYLLEEEELLTTFRLVNNYLYPGGLFLFDFNTVYKYETVIGDTVIAENRDECSFIWENYFDANTKINEYDLTLFVKASPAGQGGEPEGLYRRLQETHMQRGYTPEQMIRLVELAGMEVAAVIDEQSHEAVSPVSERVYILAREKGKVKQNG